MNLRKTRIITVLFVFMLILAACPSALVEIPDIRPSEPTAPMLTAGDPPAVPAVPTAPGTPTFAAGDGQLTVSWTAPTDNGGSAITGYTLRYTDNSTNAHFLVEGITSTSYTITGLTNGRTYTVLVRAVNAEGQSEWSAPSTAIVLVSGFATQVPAGTAASISPSAAPSRKK